MVLFQIVIYGKDSLNVYNCFRYRTNGTKVILDNYDLRADGSISFTLEYKNNDALLFSIIKTINLCSDWKFNFKVYDLIQNTLDGKKRIIYFK